MNVWATRTANVLEVSNKQKHTDNVACGMDTAWPWDGSRYLEPPSYLAGYHNQSRAEKTVEHRLKYIYYSSILYTRTHKDIYCKHIDCTMCRYCISEYCEIYLGARGRSSMLTPAGKRGPRVQWAKRAQAMPVRKTRARGWSPLSSSMAARLLRQEMPTASPADKTEMPTARRHADQGAAVGTAGLCLASAALRCSMR